MHRLCFWQVRSAGLIPWIKRNFLKQMYMHSKIGLFLFALTLYFPFTILCHTPSDSISAEQDITPFLFNAYSSQEPILGLTSSAQTIDTWSLETLQSTTLLSAINTVAGLRMEERSPGSYRLA